MSERSTESQRHDPRVALPVLEFHVAFGCNLTCESCSHYSNHTHAGSATPSELARQIALWNRKIVPKSFRLLGGEPTLNKDLLELIRIARQGWPAAGGTQLELITNGLRLERFPELPALLEQTDTRLVISVHHDAEEYQRAMAPVRALVEGWQARHSLRVAWRPSFKHWTRRYHGYGSAMRPFVDGDQRASWSNCPAKLCVQMHDDKLWKCPALAYLPMQQAKYRLGPEWQPYLGYRALDAEATLPEVAAFLAREDEPMCLMCPAKPPRFDKPNPLARARME